MVWRHEEKYLLTPDETAAIRCGLSRRMRPDPHYPQGRYIISSLYFDDDRLSAVAEKADGLAEHTKYRIRTYNGNGSRISLEKKVKKGIMTQKQSSVISVTALKQILSGSAVIEGDKTAKELWLAMRTAGLSPKCIVRYERQAFAFDALDIRVTLDSNVAYLPPDVRLLGSGPSAARGVPALQPGITILEVKYNTYLPYDIRMLTQSRELQTSFSKYAACMTKSGLITFI